MKKNMIIAVTVLLIAGLHTASAEDLQFIKKTTTQPTQKKSITNELASLPYKTLNEFQGFVEVTKNTIGQITSVKIVNRVFRHFHYSAEIADQYNVVVPELTEDQKALVEKYAARGVNVTGKYREYNGEKWLTLNSIGLFATVSNVAAGGQWYGDAKVLFSAEPDTVKENVIGTLRLTKKGSSLSTAKIVLKPSTNQTETAAECNIATDKMDFPTKQSLGKLENQVVSAFGIVKEDKGQKWITVERVIKYTPKK